MPRTLDPTAHALRRDAYVDVAQRLIQEKGYEQMSVEEILVELGASKGAFYHYFDSKLALLDAVVERTVVAATEVMKRTTNDPTLTALQQLRHMFASLASWKTERKELMLAFVEVWLCDDNVIVRDKFRQRTAASLTPLLAGIVRRGKSEGTFTAAPPEGAAHVLVALMMGLNEEATRLFLARQAGTVSLQEVERHFSAYAEAFERIVGIPPGSWPVLDDETLHMWFG